MLDKVVLEKLGKEFFERTKDRLKEFWDDYPEQVKLDIEATAKSAARVAAYVVADGLDAHASDVHHLESQLASIEMLGALAFRSLITEALADAAMIAGSFLRKALLSALTGGALAF